MIVLCVRNKKITVWNNYYTDGFNRHLILVIKHVIDLGILVNNVLVGDFFSSAWLISLFLIQFQNLHTVKCKNGRQNYLELHISNLL